MDSAIAKRNLSSNTSLKSLSLMRTSPFIAPVAIKYSPGSVSVCAETQEVQLTQFRVRMFWDTIPSSCTSLSICCHKLILLSGRFQARICRHPSNARMHNRVRVTNFYFILCCVVCLPKFTLLLLIPMH